MDTAQIKNGLLCKSSPSQLVRLYFYYYLTKLQWHCTFNILNIPTKAPSWPAVFPRLFSAWTLAPASRSSLVTSKAPAWNINEIQQSLPDCNTVHCKIVSQICFNDHTKKDCWGWSFQIHKFNAFVHSSITLDLTIVLWTVKQIWKRSCNASKVSTCIELVIGQLVNTADTYCSYIWFT